MNSLESIVKMLLERDHELERGRTRCLATQQWHKVIALEARREENELYRTRIIASLELTKNEPNPSNPISGR